MQMLNRLSLLALVLSGLLFTGCKENAVEEETTSTETATNYSTINNWVYSVMEDAYFWYDQMPALSSLDLTQDPSDFFEKLIYQRTVTDRFSLITDDIDALSAAFDGVSEVFGISYNLYYLDSGSSNIGVFVNYVVKGSPAETAGIKRGDIFTKINGTQLTAGNYTTLLSSTTATFSYATITDSVLSETGSTVSVTKATVSEDPVLFSTVISKPAYNKTIGYLVYTQFVPGTDADEEKYDNELRSAFATFKEQGVNELVLDLRFNSGGYLSSADVLGSLIATGASTSKVFYKEQWNSKYQAYWIQRYGADALNYNFLSETSNIGSNLSRVFVLTSGSTASASELIINGLKPYMDVITIGDNTAGKNLFGSLIEDDQERWKWGMYVMLGQIANANGESDYGTVNGFTPTYAVSDNVVPYKAFGDESETLFRQALDVMGIPAASANSRIVPGKTLSRYKQETMLDNLQSKPALMIRNKGKAIPAL